MNKTLLINASPRQKGTSVILLRMCADYLKEKGQDTELIHLYPNLRNPEQLYHAFGEADTIVLGGPCYINTYPADTLYLLQEISKHTEFLHGQRLYGIIQGGMPYAHTHESGLSMLELFCKKTGLQYNGGFVQGMGAALNGKPVSALPHSRKILRQLHIFFSHIEKGEASMRKVYEDAQLKLPAFLFGLMAKLMNRSIDTDLKKHGIDNAQQSPYMTMDI